MSRDDGGLSPLEHDELRDRVLAGAQRIRPAASRRARLAVAGGALLLMGAMTGGLVTWISNAAEPAVVTGRPAPRTPVWSGWLAFSAGQGDGDIYLVKAGSAPRRILGSDTDDLDQVCPAFSPDGARLAVGQGGDGGSGVPAVVIIEVGPDGEPSARSSIALAGATRTPCPVWSADGRWLAFGTKAATAAVEQVWVVDTSTRDIRRLAGLSATDLEWAPKAAELFIASNDNGISVYSTVTGKTRVLDGTLGTVALAISPDGEKLAVQHSDPSGIVDGQPVSLLLMEADGSDRRILGVHRVDFGLGPVWSPDGSRLTFQQLCATYKDESGSDRTCVEEHEVVVLAVDRANPLGPAVTRTVLAAPRSITGGEWRSWFPYSVTWSPDGRTLLYLGWFAGGNGILAVPADGAIPPAVLQDTLDVAGHSGEPWNTFQSWSRKP